MRFFHPLYLEIGLILFMVTTVHSNAPVVTLSHLKENVCIYHFNSLNCPFNLSLTAVIPFNNFNITYDPPPPPWIVIKHWRSHPVQSISDLTFQRNESNPIKAFTLTVYSTPLYLSTDLHLVTVSCNGLMIWNNYPTTQKTFLPDWNLTETMGVVAIIIWFLVGFWYVLKNKPRILTRWRQNKPRNCTGWCQKKPRRGSSEQTNEKQRILEIP